MSKRIVRASKFRHAYGVAQKRENCYEDIRVTKNSWDSNFCDVNARFLAVVTESAGGGAFLVLPLTQTGRLPADYPAVTGHRASILDLAWCPYDDYLLASASEDCSIKVWEVPSTGPAHKIESPVIDLPNAHERRACLVRWHPSAADIILTVGADCKLHVWDLCNAEILISIDTHPDQIMSATWNYNGSIILITCKDRSIRTYDARTGKLLKSIMGHTGLKPSRGIFLKDGKIVTTGFSKMSVRQYALWDLDNSDKPIVCNDIDSSNGVVFPFYDPDINMIYLAGKGDSSIRYFEYNAAEAPFIHYIDTFTSSEPYRGVAFMPKRGLDCAHCEIARFYQLKNSNYCQIVGFFVPRKSEVFQEDLYPSTYAGKAAMSADEWWKGKDSIPVQMQVRPDMTINKSQAQQGNSVRRTQQTRTWSRNSHVDLEKTADSGLGGRSDASLENAERRESSLTVRRPTPEPQLSSKVYERFMSQLNALTSIVKQLEKRIETIEGALNLKK